MNAAEEIQKLIDDLDDARAIGVVYTYGMVQQRLVEIRDSLR